MVAEPLEEGDPAVGVFQRKGIGHCRPDWTGVWPAQQPLPAVREDAHAHAALLLRLLQVVVELLDVLSVRVEAPRGADPALELDKGVEGGQVDGTAGALRGWVLLDDVITPDESCHDEEISDRAGDVRLGLASVVPSQNLGGSLSVTGVVVVYLT